VEEGEAVMVTVGAGTAGVAMEKAMVVLPETLPEESLQET